MSSRPRRTLPAAVALLVALTVVLAACGGDGEPQPVAAGDLSAVPALQESTTTTTAPPPARSALADQISPAGTAAGLPAPSGPAPTAMWFDSVGVDMAPIIPVGVEPNGEMEIPGASEIGWYRYGPTPGAAGSSVLAAHVAWDGRNGVFHQLTRAQPGDRFTIAYEDGTLANFEVVALAQYAKDELPFDQVFARTGDPTITLITCGGDFNPSLRSYRDNIVAYAVPVA
ncbi:MAG TPA: class F sortase [Acidimicrobiales bacterium]|nr:class F sortase [Acidimicrobiales bacterium]